MSITKMKRVELVCLAEDARKLADELVWLSSVEVSDPVGEALPAFTEKLFSPVDMQDEMLGWEEKIAKYEKALSIIAPYRTGNALTNVAQFDRDSFTALADSMENTDKTVQKILEADALRVSHNEEMLRIQSEIAAVSPWLSSDVSLAEKGTSQTKIVYFTIPLVMEKQCAWDDGEDDLWQVEVISRDKSFAYCLAIVHLSALSDFRARFSTRAFHEIEIAGDDLPQNIFLNCQSRLEILKKGLMVNEEHIRNLAEVGKSIEAMADQLGAEIEKAALVGRMLAGDNVRVVTGWIPEKETERFENALAGYTVAYDLRDPEEGEDVPILLKNNPVVAPFESVVGLYSYPSYKGIDPTFIMSIFYFIIFGMMLADFGYGLLLTVGCFGFIKWKKPKAGTRKMMSMFGICGISTMVFGALFGSYFGDLLSAINVSFLGGESFSLAILVDPVADPMKFLVIALAVGALHMLTAIGVKGYMLIRDGRWFDAVCDVGSWEIFFIGLGLTMLTDFSWAKYVFFTGLAMLILTQGRAKKNIIAKLFFGVASLYDLISWGSDLMSYSRILALGLAGGVVSSVINLMATMMGPSVVGFIFLIIVLAAGHGLNIAMNILGSFVHTARLQYIEFFGKFYEDGGRVFEPATLHPKYTYIQNR